MSKITDDLHEYNYIAPNNMKQTNIFDYFESSQIRRRYGRTQHGGVKTKGYRKLERPLSTTKPIHLVLKSQKARGRLSFLLPRNKQAVEVILTEKAKRFGVRIEQMANVGNHLHLKIRIKDRQLFGQFLRSVTTLIARKVTGARKGVKFGRFWQGLAFTRVLVSSREELQLRGYIRANQIEAVKSIEARNRFLEKFNAWIYRDRLRIKFLDFETG